MDPLSVTASIIAIIKLTSEVIDYLTDVRVASKESARCALEASNLNSLLVDLRFRLDGSSSNEPWHTAVRALGGKDGPIDQYRHALEQLQRKVRTGDGLKKMGKILVWRFSKEEVSSILARMERLKTLTQIALEMDHFDGVAIKDDTSFVRMSIPALGMGVNAVEQEQNRQRHDNILAWISSTDFPAQQSDFIARRQPGTGLWFLDAPEFRGWIQGSKQTLFCPGIPGAGKTMMAALAIDHLSGTVQSDTTAMAYIYCNYKAQAEQTTSRLLAAILKQLVQIRPSIAEPVTRLYNHHAGRGRRPSLDEIIGALQSILANYSTVYVIIDALDECPVEDGTRSQLLTKLRDLQRKTDLRLMVTSRFIPTIEMEFRSMIRLEVRARDADVKRFVAGQMDRLPKCIQRDDKLQDFVQDKIAEAADGMFLLARLHVDSLLDKRTKSKVQSTLESLSTGSKALYEAYDEAIKRIDGQLPDDSALATSVLSWITYAQRPLTTGELCHALAVKKGDEELDQDNILLVEDIVSICAGLVTVDEDSDIIRLVHYTTQEHFERIREKWNPSAQQEITSTCLNYLSFSSLRSGSCDSNEEFERRLEQNVFLDYAARYWGHHAQTVQEERDIIVEADSRDGYGRTPLLWAAEGGHEAVVKLLVERDDVDADSRDNDGWTPLSWAARRGHEAVVQLLVERDDVDADSKDNGRTPLSWAAEEGHEAVVKLLVERDDVDADSKNNDGGTPLSCAALRGHEAVVKLLVERDDVDADSRDKSGRTLLWWAERMGREERKTSRKILNRTNVTFTLFIEEVEAEFNGKVIQYRKDLEAKERHIHFLESELGQTGAQLNETEIILSQRLSDLEKVNAANQEVENESLMLFSRLESSIKEQENLELRLQQALKAKSRAVEGQVTALQGKNEAQERLRTIEAERDRLSQLKKQAQIRPVLRALDSNANATSLASLSSGMNLEGERASCPATASPNSPNVSDYFQRITLAAELGDLRDNKHSQRSMLGEFERSDVIHQSSDEMEVSEAVEEGGRNVQTPVNVSTEYPDARGQTRARAKKPYRRSKSKLAARSEKKWDSKFLNRSIQYWNKKLTNLLRETQVIDALKKNPWRMWCRGGVESYQDCIMKTVCKRGNPLMRRIRFSLGLLRLARRNTQLTGSLGNQVDQGHSIKEIITLIGKEYTLHVCVLPQAW
ncbi:MAG: hypothetical protein M1816_001650 [Peltula sp. TS41687]|nr:MAG: hypothetical protein M1816_001650 [Peltula sp. TS41687]